MEGAEQNNGIDTREEYEELVLRKKLWRELIEIGGIQQENRLLLENALANATRSNGKTFGQEKAVIAAGVTAALINALDRINPLILHVDAELKKQESIGYRSTESGKLSAEDLAVLHVFRELRSDLLQWLEE
jgi:hypothetical protein